MANVTPSWVKVEGDNNSYVWTWAMVTANVNGLPIESVQFVDVCFQAVASNWGGATVTIQGSNDGTNWFSLTNASGGAAVTFAADGGKQVIERPRYIRPCLTTPGAAAVVSITAMVRRNPVNPR